VEKNKNFIPLFQTLHAPSTLHLIIIPWNNSLDLASSNSLSLDFSTKVGEDYESTEFGD